jgi:hypothetical protein
MLLHGILLHQTCSGISVLSLVRGAPVRNMPSTDTRRRSLPYGQLPSPRYRDGVIVVQPASGIIPSRLSICRCSGSELGVPSSPGRCLRSAAQFTRTAFRRIGREQRHRAIAPHKQPPSRRHRVALHLTFDEFEPDLGNSQRRFQPLRTGHRTVYDRMPPIRPEWVFHQPLASRLRLYTDAIRRTLARRPWGHGLT